MLQPLPRRWNRLREPDIFKVTLDKLGDIDPEDVIVVGDTPYDAESCSKVNLRDWCTLWWVPGRKPTQGRLHCHLPRYSLTAGRLRRVSTQVVLG